MPTVSPTEDANGQAIALEFIQSQFAGGMNRLEDSTQVGPTEYPLLVNGRNRLGTIKPIPKPLLDMTGLPANLVKIQGLYSAANYGLAFVDGLAYYKDYTVDGSIWNQIPQFSMDAGVDTIYIALVESSTINYQRKLATTDIGGVVTLTGVASSSPQAVVVQDGINQPWLILPDATARVTQSYGEWSQDNREYVPIGTLTMYSEENGILYVYDPKTRLVYRSVSGRPIDFVVNIDANGDKGGDATTTAHAISYDPLIAMKQLNTQEGGFYASTAKVSYRVVPDFAFTAFAEPFFSNRRMFDTGAINQFSIVELLGDTMLITDSGITSFNAVQMYRNEGRNSPFSQRIAAILEDVQQDANCCCGFFDNYGLFSVQTIYGPAVVIFDELRNTIVGLDIYAGVARITQFAEIKVAATRRLLFRTLDNKIYEAFAAEDEVEQVKLYVGDWSSGNPKVQVKPNYYKVVFQDAIAAGTISATCYVDGKAGKTLQQTLNAVKSPSTLPVTLPFGDSSSDSVQPITFDFSTENQGWKIGLFLTWSVPEAKLSSVYLSANTIKAQTSFEQQSGISKKASSQAFTKQSSKSIF
jgi:hypothetical protein